MPFTHLHTSKHYSFLRPIFCGIAFKTSPPIVPGENNFSFPGVTIRYLPSLNYASLYFVLHVWVPSKISQIMQVGLISDSFLYPALDLIQHVTHRGCLKIMYLINETERLSEHFLLRELGSTSASRGNSKQTQ